MPNRASLQTKLFKSQFFPLNCVALIINKLPPDFFFLQGFTMPMFWGATTAGKRASELIKARAEETFTKERKHWCWVLVILDRTLHKPSFIRCHRGAFIYPEIILTVQSCHIWWIVLSKRFFISSSESHWMGFTSWYRFIM